METLHPHYITDNTGKKISVVISIEQFNSMVEELEELDDIRLYDEAKRNDDGGRIPMLEAFKIIESKRQNT